VTFSTIAMDIKQIVLHYLLLDRKDIPSMNNFVMGVIDLLWPLSYIVSLYSISLQFLYGLAVVMLVLGVILMYRRKKQQSIQVTDEETGKVKQETIRVRVPLSFCTKILLLILLILIAEVTISSMYGGMSIQRLCNKTPEIMTSQFFTQNPNEKNMMAVPYFLEAAYYGFVQPESIKHSLFYEEYSKLLQETEILSYQLGIGDTFNEVKSQLVLCNGTVESNEIFDYHAHSWSYAISVLKSAVSSSSEQQDDIITLRDPTVLPFYAAKDKLSSTLTKLHEVMSLSDCRRIYEAWSINWDLRVCTHAQTGLVVMSVVGLAMYGALLAAVAPSVQRQAWTLFCLFSSFILFTFAFWSTT